MSQPIHSLLVQHRQRAVASALRHWRLDVAAVQPVSGGFSTASVYRVLTTDQETLAVRCTPATARSESRDRQLVTLLRHIHESGLPVVTVPRSHADATASTPQQDSERDSTSVIRENHVWYVEPWREGRPVTGDQLSPSMTAEALTCIQHFHNEARAWAAANASTCFSVATRRSRAVARRREMVQSLVTGELNHLRDQFDSLNPDLREPAKQLASVLTRQLVALLPVLQDIERQPFDTQPVIRDLWRNHVLFSGTNVSGLIDFWECGSDHVFVDFARLFRSWMGADNAGVHALWQRCLSSRTTSKPEFVLLNALDACTVLLSPVTWLRRFLSCASGDPISPAIRQRFAELCAVASRFRPFELEF